MHRHAVPILVVTALLFAWSMPLHAEDATPPASFRIIVHPEVRIDDVSDTTLHNIFLMKSSRWPTGQKIHPAVLKSGAVHEDFLRTIVQKSLNQYASFCRVLIFTGNGRPPKTFSDEAKLVEWVARTPGAVGYVGATTPVDGVKVVP